MSSQVDNRFYGINDLFWLTIFLVPICLNIKITCGKIHNCLQYSGKFLTWPVFGKDINDSKIVSRKNYF